jgi:hypothetical protein
VRYLLLARLALIAVTLAGATLAGNFAVSSATSVVAADAPEPIAPAPVLAPSPRVAPDSLARLIAGRNPFRASRAASVVRFDPRGTDNGGPPPQFDRPPRPQFVLAGILLGAEPAALIDGLPGAGATRVLRAGERFGEYHVRSITTDAVVIAGRDTTWTIRLRSRFQ